MRMCPDSKDSLVLRRHNKVRPSPFEQRARYWSLAKKKGGEPIQGKWIIEKSRKTIFQRVVLR
jgi:hypothetical protein